MNQKRTLSFILEIVWWLFTLFVAIAVLYPIYTTVPDYPFYGSNILFIIILITLTRYIFLLKHTFLAHFEYLKVAIILFSAITIFLLVNQLNFFQTYLDEKGLESFLGNMDLARQESMGRYIRQEMLFFGVGSVIAAILLPIRMVISIWRSRNLGTV